MSVEGRKPNDGEKCVMEQAVDIFTEILRIQIDHARGHDLGAPAMGACLQAAFGGAFFRAFRGVLNPNIIDLDGFADLARDNFIEGFKGAMAEHADKEGLKQ